MIRSVNQSETTNIIADGWILPDHAVDTVNIISWRLMSAHQADGAPLAIFVSVHPTSRTQKHGPPWPLQFLHLPLSPPPHPTRGSSHSSLPSKRHGSVTSSLYIKSLPPRTVTARLSPIDGTPRQWSGGGGDWQARRRPVPPRVWAEQRPPDSARHAARDTTPAERPSPVCVRGVRHSAG